MFGTPFPTLLSFFPYSQNPYGREAVRWRRDQIDRIPFKGLWPCGFAARTDASLEEGGLARLPRSWFEQPRSRQAGQATFLNKHNKNSTDEEIKQGVGTGSTRTCINRPLRGTTSLLIGSASLLIVALHVVQSTLVLIQRISQPIYSWFDELTFLISFLIKKQIVIYNEINLKFPFKLRVLRKMTSPNPTTTSLPKSALLNQYSREIQKKKSLFCLFAHLFVLFLCRC